MPPCVRTQELEKFKFVLNYKIQELKRQILPRKREIQNMREQMKVGIIRMRGRLRELVMAGRLSLRWKRIIGLH